MNFIIKPNPSSHYMKPGAVAMIPGWIMLLITILTLAIIHPGFFPEFTSHKTPLINQLLLALIIGSLLPAFDDLFAFVFGKPFAHHTFFHSLLGPVFAFIFFYLFTDYKIALYVFLGNFYHIFFNFLLDYTTLFFPFTYREFGLTHLINVSTYNIKAVAYPLILALFFFAVYKALLG